MPQNENQKIKINSAHGGKDKDELKKLFFYPNGTGTYDLYQKDNPIQLVTGVSSGSTFTFSIPPSTIVWTVPDPNNSTHPFHIDNDDAGGSWKNNDTSIDNDPEGESGTFSAQAGGTIDGEAAAAKAY